MQGITGQLGIFIEQTRILGVEQVPSLLFAEKSEPFSAQLVDHRRVFRTRDKGFHCCFERSRDGLGADIIQAQAQLVITDVHLQRCFLQTLGVSFQLGCITGEKSIVCSKKIRILIRQHRRGDQ